MSLVQSIVSIRLFHVVRNMGQTTVKPEQEPEQVKGVRFGAWRCVSVVRGEILWGDVAKCAGEGMAQQDDPILMEG